MRLELGILSRWRNKQSEPPKEAPIVEEPSFAELARVLEEARLIDINNMLGALLNVSRPTDLELLQLYIQANILKENLTSLRRDETDLNRNPANQKEKATKKIVEKRTAYVGALDIILEEQNILSESYTTDRGKIYAVTLGHAADDLFVRQHMLGLEIRNDTFVSSSIRSLWQSEWQPRLSALRPKS